MKKLRSLCSVVSPFLHSFLGSVRYLVLGAVAISIFSFPVLHGSSRGLPLTADKSAVPTQENSVHKPFTVKNDEFSVLMPVKPAVAVNSDRPYRFKGGEVKFHFETGAYQAGVVFLVEVYENSNPETFLKQQSERRSAYTWKNAVKSEIDLNGVAGRQYVVKTEDLYLVSQIFNSKRRSYFVTVAARDASSPSIKLFLSSLRVSKKNSGTDLNTNSPNPSESSFDQDVKSRPLKDDSGQVFTIKEVTRKAVVIWKPEPSYTEEARQQQVMGIVKLSAVLSSSGEVSDIKVEKRLSDGLTNRAIAAARKLKFIPAEKDGKLVSLRIQMEYYFNLY